MPKSKKYLSVQALIEILGVYHAKDVARFAQQLETTPAYVYQVAHGFRRASPELAMRIDQVCDGEAWPRVRKEELRPDLWRPLAA